MNLISIIVPNLHSPIIGETLRSLNAQSYQGEYEVIVVGQDRFGLVQESDRVRSIKTPQPCSSAVNRNLGIQAALGEILVFTDADCVAAPDWLEQLIAHYTDEQKSVVGGGVAFPTENIWTFCDNLATFYEYLTTSQPGLREQLPSLNLSMRRACLDTVGVFDERYPKAAGEDADLTMRLRLAGYPLYFEPSAQVIHLPQRRSLKSLFQHAYHFGRYSIKVDPRYRELIHIPWVLRHWLSVCLAAPILAAGVTLRVSQVKINLWYKLLSLPVIFGIKLAWCIGAAHTLKSGSVLVK